MASEMPASKEAKKALAMAILPLAREKGIRLPPTDARAAAIVGRAMLNIVAGEGSIEERTLAELEEARGLQTTAANKKRARKAAKSKAEDDDEAAGDAEDGTPSKKRKAEPVCENAANTPVHDALKELSSFYFEEAKTAPNKKFGAIGLVKLCKFIRMMPEEICSGKQVREWIGANDEDPKATRACGPTQMKRIDEILKSPDHTFEELVAKREEHDNQEE